MDQGPEEINVLLPAMFAVFALFIASLSSLVMSYLLQYRVILIETRPIVPRVLKGFGVFGLGLTLVVGLAFIVLLELSAT